MPEVIAALGDTVSGVPEESPYWWQAAPRAARESDIREPPASADVVIIGSGFTGLNAALTLARAGRSVAVLDAAALGDGASTRNAGFVSRAFKHDFRALEKRHGLTYAKQLYRELDDAVRAVIRRVEEENIDCHLRLNGRFMPTASRADLDDMAADLDAQRRHLGFEFDVLPRHRVGEELATDLYEGGAVLEGLGGLHPGLYHEGLLRAGRAAGVTFYPWTAARRIDGTRNAFTVHTSRGTIAARDVVIGTNGYTAGLLPWLDRRLIPFDAFMIATRVLPPGALERAIPGGKVAIDSNRNALYIRPSPDRSRVLFGGLTGAAARDLAGRARKLAQMLGTLVPDLAGIEPDTVWTGKCAATFDLFPHMGCHRGIFFAAGYCFVGVPMGTYLGTKLGHAVLGQREASSIFAARSFRTLPFYTGRPWFIPVVTRYWQQLDSRTPSGRLA